MIHPLSVQFTNPGQEQTSHSSAFHDLHNEFQQALKGYKMRSSMSRKGDCWDNAVNESLRGSLKVARLHGRRFETRREAMDEVIDWLTFYNHRRLHSTQGYVSPMQFERAWLGAQEKRAA